MERSSRWNTEKLNEKRFRVEISKGIEGTEDIETERGARAETVVTATMKLITQHVKSPCHGKDLVTASALPTGGLQGSRACAGNV